MAGGGQAVAAEPRPFRTPANILCFYLGLKPPGCRNCAATPRFVTDFSVCDIQKLRSYPKKSTWPEKSLLLSLVASWGDCDDCMIMEETDGKSYCLNRS